MRSFRRPHHIRAAPARDPGRDSESTLRGQRYQQDARLGWDQGGREEFARRSVGPGLCVAVAINEEADYPVFAKVYHRSES
jgi:hypothetical protein